MSNKLTPEEIVFGSSDPAESRRIRRAVNRGQLRKVGPRTYTSNQADPLPALVRKNWKTIVAHLFPGAVISFASALQIDESCPEKLYLTTRYRRHIKLPGLDIWCYPGIGPQAGDREIAPGLYVASLPRTLLENMAPSRDRGHGTKTLDPEQLQAIIKQQFFKGGWSGLSQLHRRTKALASAMKSQERYIQYQHLEQQVRSKLKSRYSQLDPASQHVHLLQKGELDALKRNAQVRDAESVHSGNARPEDLSPFLRLDRDKVKIINMPSLAENE